MPKNCCFQTVFSPGLRVVMSMANVSVLIEVWICAQNICVYENRIMIRDRCENWNINSMLGLTLPKTLEMGLKCVLWKIRLKASASYISNG